MPIVRVALLLCSYASLALIAVIFATQGAMWGYGPVLQPVFYVVIPGALVGFFMRIFRKNKPVFASGMYLLNSVVTVTAFVCAVLLLLVLGLAPDFSDVPPLSEQAALVQE